LWYAHTDEPRFDHASCDACLLQEKCTLRARWEWAALTNGANVQLCSVTLFRLPPMKTAGKKKKDLQWQQPAVKAEISSALWEKIHPYPELAVIPTAVFPPGTKLQYLDESGAPIASPPAGASAAEAEHECATCGAKREVSGGCCALGAALCATAPMHARRRTGRHTRQHARQHRSKAVCRHGSPGCCEGMVSCGWGMSPQACSSLLGHISP
jgi:hypothetical protein